VRAVKTRVAEMEASPPNPVEDSLRSIRRPPKGSRAVPVRACQRPQGPPFHARVSATRGQML